MSTYSIEIGTAPPVAVAVAHFHIGTAQMVEMPTRIGAAFAAVFAALGRAGAIGRGPAIACYAQVGDGFDVAAGFPFDGHFEPDGEVDVVTVGGCEAAHTIHIGGYEGLPRAYEALRAGTAEQGRALDETAPMWEEYWTGPETPPEETRTAIWWPVTSAA